MDFSNIHRENGKLSFRSTVDAETFDAAINKAYLKAKKSISVPGFRKGKAPRMIVEAMYGASVFYEDAVELLALDAFQAGMDECKDRTVGDPAITNYNVTDDKALTIDFEVALYPDVTLGDYKGISAYKSPVEITDEDVDKELQAVRKRNERIVTVEREAKEGDTVNLDFEGFKDGVPFDGGKGEGQDLVLGSGTFVPGFEEQLVGMKTGDEKEIDITFPEDYHKDLAGAAVVFKVKINEVKESELPELDDEFAKDVSEFDTLDDYKASIKTRLEESRSKDAETAFKNKVMAKAVENTTVTIPSVMVDERVNQIIADYARNCAMQGMTVEQYFGMMGIDEKMFRTYIRPSAENDVKTELMLEKIVETENIEVSEEEIEEQYQKAAENFKMDVEEIKKAVLPEVFERDVKLNKAATLVTDAGIPTDKEEMPEADESASEAKPEEEVKEE